MDEISVEKIIEVEKIQPNSVILFKLKEVNPTYIEMLKAFRDRYIEILKEKNVTCVILQSSDTIEVMPEPEMNKIGWFKKEESKIIL